MLVIAITCGHTHDAWCKDRKAIDKRDKNQITISCRYALLPGGGGGFFFRAQTTSQLTLNTGEQLSIAYQRQVRKSFSVGMQYTYWKTKQDLLGYDQPQPPDDRVKGWVSRRWGYQHLDLMGSYHLKVSRRHSVDFSGGISYARGWDKVIDAQQKDRTSGYPYYSQYHNRLTNYLGGIAQLKYDYSFWKGRWSIGINVNCRGYYQFQGPMFTAGLHASVNF